MNFICTAFSDVMFTGLLTKAWSMSSWKSFVFKITCHVKQTILCRMSALGQNSEKGVRDYCKFNSAWNGSSKRRVRAVLSGYWPMWERGLHWVHGRLQGHFALWIALTILLMPQQEQPSQLLTPGRQESWRERETNKEKKRSGKIFGTVTNHLLAKLQSCIFYLQITI